MTVDPHGVADATSRTPSPSISVVVCCYSRDRLDDLLAAVASVQAQPIPNLDVLVVVDHNTPLAEELSSLLRDVRILENRGPKGLSGARNTALDATQSDLIAFIDDDAIAMPDWLPELLAPFADPQVIAVGGRADARWVVGRPGWFPPEFDWVVGCTHLGSPEDQAVVRNVIGCNMAFRTAPVREVGAFRTDLGRVGKNPLGCEETELCIRLRRAEDERLVVFTPGARVTHVVPATRGTPRYFFSRCYAEGISKALVSSLVGVGAGLSAERTYTATVLPKAAVRNLAHAIRRRDAAGLGRAAMIVAGLATTTFGYLVGRTFRRRPDGVTRP